MAQSSVAVQVNLAESKARKRVGQSQWSIALQMLRKNKTAMAGLVGLILLLLTAFASPWLAPYSPTQIDYKAALAPPSGQHWFGTDELGRDTFSRLLWGGRESLRVGFLAVFISLLGGILIGLISGYYAGTVDFVIQRFVDILLAFPGILLTISIIAILGPGLTTVMVAMGASGIPHYIRLVRSSVLSARNLEYVTAARVIGTIDRMIMLRHILPNIVAPLIVFSTVSLGNTILVTAGFSYLGLGAQPPSPEWGAMLNAAREFIRDAWWLSVFPGLAIFAAVLCVNLLGDGLRDALDPRLRQ